MYEELIRLINRSNKIVFFTGAGASVASGIPDFRSPGGVYSKEYRNMEPSDIVSGHFLESRPEMFFDFYRERLLYPSAKPNSNHFFPAMLEGRGRNISVVTQNIDGLYQAAGVSRVLEVHGSSLRNYCTECGKEFNMLYIYNSVGIPKCDICGKTVRPDVVLFDECLPPDVFDRAKKDIYNADMLIIVGTSLTVQPACSLINFYRGDDLIIMNLTPTSADRYARLVIRDSADKVFEYLMEREYDF